MRNPDLEIFDLIEQRAAVVAARDAARRALDAAEAAHAHNPAAPSPAATESALNTIQDTLDQMEVAIVAIEPETHDGVVAQSRMMVERLRGVMIDDADEDAPSDERLALEVLRRVAGLDADSVSPPDGAQ